MPVQLGGQHQAGEILIITTLSLSSEQFLLCLVRKGTPPRPEVAADLHPFRCTFPTMQYREKFTSESCQVWSTVSIFSIKEESSLRASVDMLPGWFKPPQVIHIERL
ncbi:MAG: hypothetical protein DI613_14080 [Kocuria rhizophila]|nr:MAG: hypothetical protein DI613_14080 [Kocuria rhizophila]